MDSRNLVKNKAPITWFLVLLLIAISDCAQGSIECEELPIEDCAFAVSSSGARCVLEKYVFRDGASQFECQTSMIMAEKKIEWIETLECVNSCGLSRMTVGLSTDTLLGKEFTARLCSPECQDNCPNIFDLYIKLAAGDGLYLPHLCRLQTVQSRRLIFNPVEDTKPKDTTPWLQENGLSSSWTYYKEAPVDHDHAHDSAVPAASEPSGSTQSDSEKDWTSPAPAPVESKDTSKRPLPISPVPQIQQQPHSMPASSPNWASSLFEFIY